MYLDRYLSRNLYGVGVYYKSWLVPFTFYRTSNEEDIIVVFLWKKILDPGKFILCSCCINPQFPFMEKALFKINIFKFKTRKSPSCCKFQGIGTVNQAIYKWKVTWIMNINSRESLKKVSFLFDVFLRESNYGPCKVRNFSVWSIIGVGRKNDRNKNKNTLGKMCIPKLSLENVHT